MRLVKRCARIAGTPPGQAEPTRCRAAMLLLRRARRGQMAEWAYGRRLARSPSPDTVGASRRGRLVAIVLEVRWPETHI